jgi:hypothetical protein
MEETTYNSLELRWFMPGAIPAPLLEAFESGGSVVAERRRDAYWPIRRMDIGVKRRNGGPVEMKVRRSARPWDLPSGSAVVSEQWDKWRPRRLSLDRPTDVWLEVEKTLWTRTFAPAGKEVGGRSDGRTPRCEVELAGVTVASSTWWTVALEATGPARLRPSVLRATFDQLWAPTFERWLEGGVNAGYPEWLGRVTCLTGSR